MEQFKIFCTEAQTKKALELGAPLNKIGQQISDTFEDVINRYKLPRYRWKTKFCYEIPTAEQMLGWLKETYDLHISIDYRRDYADDADGNVVDEWYYYCCFVSIADRCFYGEDILDEYLSRKEATLAAIDAALEYLTNNKK